MTEEELSPGLQAWLDSWGEKILIELGPDADDRTLVIVSAAFLDTHLSLLMAGFLVDEEREVNELLDPEKPLGSFGAKIRAAYCLGLISNDEYHDLKIIKNLRNTFAHKLGVSFTDQSIRDQCSSLKLTYPSPLASGSRNSFLAATISLAAHLGFRIGQAEKHRCVVPSEVYAQR